jgi:Cu-Zn family superoxide dismutase
MNRLTLLTAPAVVSLALLGGCESMRDERTQEKHEEMAQEGVAPNAQKQAVANIRTSPAATTQPADGKPTGTVTFTQQADGKVRVVADVKGLKPNTTHGFHVHEKGDLSAPDFTSAGGHFNPEGHPHAGPDQSPRHAGDFGNLKADAQGNAHLELTVDNISLGGAKNDVIGKAVIVHAKADDLKSQPTGDAGGRIGGGIIEMKK